MTSVKIDADRAARRLAGALRYRTISRHDPDAIDRKEFLAFHRYLKTTYRTLHRSLKRETVNGMSLLYTWEGEDKNAAPILLMAHLDVVPADSAGEWTHPPFSGTIAGGFVWGRGSLDDKNSAIGIMESVELLLERGFTPKRTIYLAFGHDEEVLGGAGASAISALLGQRGVRLACVLDEGGFIRDAIVPGVAGQTALVGIAEKGYLTLELSISGAAGHSSMPPRSTSVGRLAAALCRLELRRFPARFTAPVREMFSELGRTAAAPYRYVYANPLSRPALMLTLAADPESDAMIRTTIAPTMLAGSSTENVMPDAVRATVNFRILQGESRESVIARVRRIIRDAGVIISANANSCEPSPVTDVRSPEYAALKQTIAALFPGVIVTPFLMVGATDSRHFAPIAGQILRFTPSFLNGADMARIHGVDERIAVRNLGDFIEFYAAFIRRMAG